MDSLRIVVSVIAGASALATLIGFAVSFREGPLQRSSIVTRAGLVAALIIFSVISGIAALDDSPRQNPLVTSDREVAALPEPVKTTESRVDTDQLQSRAQMSNRGDTPIRISTQPRPQPDSVKTRPSANVAPLEDRITLSARDRDTPEVAAAADDALAILRSRFSSVRGSLRSNQSEPDAALHGLITTDLTLDVKVLDAKGVVQSTFTITSRGGGFTPDASTLQARERLRAALQKHVDKESL